MNDRKARRRMRGPGRVPAAVAVVLLAVASFACDGGERTDRVDAAPAVAFDTAAARIVTETDTFRLTVEVAETDEQRAHGLMERRELPEEHGMIFTYPEPQEGDAGFWMFRTRIPLDIAYLDEDGRIAAIRSMEPCESPYAASCPTYAPGTPYSAALEVNRGYFERRGIGVGDRVVFMRDA